MPTSKPLRAWLAAAPQVVIDPHAAWHEPTRRRRADARVGRRPDPRRARLRDRDARERARPRLARLLARRRRARAGRARGRPRRRSSRSCSPRLEPELPDDALVWISSSMPVRDVEAFFPQSPKRIRFLANRGANGIDGVTSSALGAALATGLPTWLLTGELALLHDLGGLFAARRAGVRARDRLRRQRRRRDLRLPAGGRARRPASLRAATSPPRRRRLGGGLARPRHARLLRPERAALATSRSTASCVERVGAQLACERSGRAAEAAPASLTSVSASSSAGTESRTIPQPAYRWATGPRSSAQRSATQNSPSSARSVQPTAPGVPAAVEALERRYQRQRRARAARRPPPGSAAAARRARRPAPGRRAGRGSAWPGAERCAPSRAPAPPRRPPTG